MKQNPRDPRTWTNVQIEADSEGYVAAQQACREDQEAAIEQQRDADDERAWTEEYIQQGGREKDAPAAYRAFRNQQAAERAGRAEEAALEGARRQVRSTL